MLHIIRRILLLLPLFTGTVYAQLSYQLNNYSFAESGAGNQNWDIDIDDRQRVLIANKYGLLVLTNTNSILYQPPNKTIFRSVAFIDGRIYTGAFEDFGYWEESAEEGLAYTSLVPFLKDPEMNNDEIWSIVKHQDKIYFHSFGSIYSYDGDSVERIRTDRSLMLLHKANNEIYTQKVNGGLYRLDNDKFFKIPGSDLFSDEEVKSIIALDKNSLLIGTSDGIYTYSDSVFNNWSGELRSEVVRNSVNTMVHTGNKIVIGTILNGIYIYDLDFNLIKNINTQNQLINNTILSLKADSFGNLWVGMDKGLTYIAFNTPMHTYRTPSNPIGSVYASALFNNELYIGTNQGIYWYKRDSEGIFYDRKLVPESQGQVWFLKEFDGNLYCGLNDGTYIIKDKKLEKISDIFGGFNLKPYPAENLNVLVQGTYTNISVYEKVDEIWQQSYNLEEFSTPARFLEFDHVGNIWIGHVVRGMYRLQPDIQFTRIETVTQIGENEGLSQNSNRVFKLDNRIMTSVDDSLFQWDSIRQKFVPYTKLDPFFTVMGPVRNIVPAGQHRYWVIKHSEAILVEVHFETVRLLYRLIPDKYNYNMVEEYENIIPLNETLHVICLEDGFAVLNLELGTQTKHPKPTVQVSTLKAASSKNEDFKDVLLDGEKVELPYRDNTVKFMWSSSRGFGNQSFYQYRLLGLEQQWSNWNNDTNITFERLQSGDYTFQVRSMGSNGLLTETAGIEFKIKQPWYFSRVAYLFYFLILLSFGFMIRLYISRKRWKALGRNLEIKQKKTQRDRENAEKEIIKLNNEKLQQEIEHKTSQLASNTMSIMRKNNLLSSIKDELKQQKAELGDDLPDTYVKSITKLIDQGIEDEHEWEVFEQLYDQAHGNFFKRLKEKYPQLTPSDLRLCAYLRMNLSSKEIAPLLNISVRGVEERRYRLRKRLDLSTGTNLTELIMTF